MNDLVLISSSQLKELLSDTIKENLSEFLNEQQPHQSETKYLTRKQTADLLHISLSTLDTYTRQGILNAKRVGKRVLYSSDDLSQSMIDKIINLKHKMK